MHQPAKENVQAAQEHAQVSEQHGVEIEQIGSRLAAHGILNEEQHQAIAETGAAIQHHAQSSYAAAKVAEQPDKHASEAYVSAVAEHAAAVAQPVEAVNVFLDAAKGIQQRISTH